MVVVQSQADLFEVVAAPRPIGCLADLLHRRQQEADQDGDDGDDHQQLDQREAAAAQPGGKPGSSHDLPSPTIRNVWRAIDYPFCRNRPTPSADGAQIVSPQKGHANKKKPSRKHHRRERI